MKRSLRIHYWARSVLASGLALGTSLGAMAEDNSLFSEIRAQSVFDSTSGTATAAGVDQSQSTVSSRLLSAEALVERLKAAGFADAQATGRSAMITMSVDDLSLPAEVQISDDEQHISILLSLSPAATASQITALQNTPTTKKQLPSAEILTALMELNSTEPRVRYAWNSSRQELRLVSVLENLNLSALTLRDELNQLTSIARSSSSLWKPVAISESQADQLIGRWSAARSNTEAFAIEFTAGNVFSLIFVQNGKQTRSSGTYRLEGQNLVLNTGNGGNLQGTFQRKTADEFLFAPAAADGKPGSPLTFRRANPVTPQASPRK